MTAEKHQMTAEKHQMTADKHQMTADKHQMTADKHQMTADKHQMTADKHPKTADKHKKTAGKHRVSKHILSRARVLQVRRYKRKVLRLASEKESQVFLPLATFMTLSAIYPLLFVTSKCFQPFDKRLKFKRATHLQRESNGQLEIKPILSLLANTLETFALPIVYLTSLTTSLINLIISIRGYLLLKQNNARTGKALLINAIINFTATLLLGITAGITAEFPDMEDLMSTLNEVTETIVEEEVVQEENKEKYPGLNPKQQEFLNKVAQDKMTSPIMINAYYRSKFSESDFLLPPNRPPIKTPMVLKQASESFKYPDEFLVIWWQTTLKYVEGCRHIIKMSSKTHLNEDLRADNVACEGEEPKEYDPTEHEDSDWTAPADKTIKKTGFVPTPDMIEDLEKAAEKEIPKRLRHILRHKRTIPQPDRSEPLVLLPNHILANQAQKAVSEIAAYERSNRNTSLEDATKENLEQHFFDDSYISIDSLKTFVNKVLLQLTCVMMAIGDAFISKKSLSCKSIIEYVSLTPKITKISGDLKDAVYVLLNKETPSDGLNVIAEEYARKFNHFIDQPSFALARALHMVSDMQNTLSDYEFWQRTLTPEDQRKFSALHGLYTTAHKKRVSFITNDMPTLSRQEPFLILLQGETGVGKTSLADEVVYRICKDVLRIHPATGSVDITPSDKYWPPLGGMKDVYKFDEACTSRDITKDLLFGNMKGICSSAYFNCAAADVEHKINPCTAKVIVATSNTSFEDMANRVSTTNDAESWKAMCRRSFMIKVSRANKHYDPNHPENDVFDSVNYTHLKLDMHEYRDGKLQFIKEVKLEYLMRLIADKESFMADKHRNKLAKMNMMQESSASHFSVVVHGQQGQGKSFFLGHLMRNMPSAFNFPIILIKEKAELLRFKPQKRRIILCIDDVLRNTIDPEIENAFMDIYNNKLIPCSIIVNTTNVVAKPTYPYLAGTHVVANRLLPFENEGMGRRVGFVGCMNSNFLPTYNREYYVSNQTYFERNQNISMSLKEFALWIIPAILSALFILFHAIFLPLTVILTCIALYGIRSLIFNDKVTGFTCNELGPKIFTAYRDYMDRQREIPIHYRTFTKSDDYNLLIKARTGDDIIMSGNVSDLHDHVFCNRVAYDNCNLGWKLYISEEIFREFSKNYEKFLMRCTGFTVELMYSIVRKYVNALKDSAITPKFYVEIDDLGRLEYRDGEISADLNAEVPTQLNFSFVKTEVEWLILFKDIILPVTRLIKEPELSETLNLTFTESIEYNNFIKSDAFLSSSAYLETQKKVVEEEIITYGAAKWKIITDKIKEWKRHPIFKIVLILLTIVATATIVINIISFIKGDSNEPQRRKGNKKGNPKAKKYDSDDDKRRRQNRSDSSSDEEEYQRRKNSRKGNPKTKKYDSDDDKKRRQVLTSTKESRSKFNPEELQKEDVMSLCDMNDFSPYKLYIDNAYKRARTNLLQVYIAADSRDIIPNEPIGDQCCYAMFLTGTMFMTVGHAVPAIGNLYACSDSFEGAHRCEMIYKYTQRDISVWWIPTLDKKFCAKSIKKHFLKHELVLDETTTNAVIQRFGPKKTEEFHSGELTFCKTPYYFGNDIGKMGEYGQLQFGTSAIKLTTFGDCGLPYYYCESSPSLHDKILGIHCMGNSLGYTSVGISALVYHEDISHWEQMYQKLRASHCWQTVILRAEADGETPTKSPCCDMSVSKITIKQDDKPKCPDHQTVWHHIHESSISTFLDEAMTFIRGKQSFQGIVIKNSGKLMGTQEHSHTQFLPKQRLNIDKTHGWLIKRTDDCEIDVLPGELLFVKTTAIPMSSFANHFSRMNDMGVDFRIRGQIYNDPLNKRMMFRYTIFFLHSSVAPKTKEQIECKDTISYIQHMKQSKETFAIEPPFGGPVYVSQPIKELLDTATLTKLRGHPEDVPFDSIIGNETVEVIGSFHQSQSHTPKNHYHLSPFSALIKDIIPINKKPCEFDLDKTPQEIKDKMALNNYGIPCQRTTQALQWAHPNHILDGEFGTVVDNEFAEKILRYYSGLRILSDEEVLNGLGRHDPDRDFFQGMELDSSIGFTMKNSFHVTKKNDVLHCDEQGNYSWLNNAAAEFLKSEYELAKELASEGKSYFVAYLELLKMEKLKLAKIYTGRTFVVQDVLGVMMERKILGNISIRAMKDDPTCGVGTDPTKHFHKYYLTLSKFPNIWAGDYARFDRTEPADVFKRISKLLQKANPHMAKEIKAAFNVIIYRFQITGNTLAFVQGGMPSGCTLTAPLNSIVNDYLLFACYVKLMRDFNFAFSWQHYEANVKRLFYGDDVLVSISDELDDIFTRDKVSIAMMELFGMTLDSAAKDGTIATFDNWQTASWISRSFRKIEQFPYIVGALKKISIEANFHYVTSIDFSHLGSLMTKALFEAAFWEDEYYMTILEAVTRCIRHSPALAKHVLISDRLLIQREVYESALPILCAKHRNNLYPQIIEGDDQLTLKEINADLPAKSTGKQMDLNKSNVSNCLGTLTDFIDIPQTKRYKRLILHKLDTIFEQRLETMSPSYRSKLNEAFQHGKIQPVTTKFTPTNIWACDMTSGLIGQSIVETWGTGNSKAHAVEAASYLMLLKLSLITPEKKESKQFQRIDLNNLERQMNVAKQVNNVVPKAPFLAADVSVVPDAGLYTNTDAPALAQDVNNTAISLDNPAGTGAAFSKHQSCYTIYQNWESKNSTINPSMSKGTEIFRLTLDPATWPAKISEYVMFHNSILPAIDVIVTIAGAAGTIGWIKSGWVKDASNSKKYTSDDLQQVESKVVNMNGTQVMKFTIHDVRRTGLYRLTKNDPEPFPGIIFLIESAVTNVQRNDGVNYPVRVQVKLNNSCLLMEPFGTSGNQPSTIDFPLGTYFYDDEVDALVMGSSVPNEQKTLIACEEEGWVKGEFRPTFSALNVIGYGVDKEIIDGTSKKVFIITDQPSLTADVITDLGAFKTADQWYGNPITEQYPPQRLFFGFGKLPINVFTTLDGKKDVDGATVYSCQYEVQIGQLIYKNSVMYVYPEGCVIVVSYDYALQDIDTNQGPAQALVVLNSAKDAKFDFFESQDGAIKVPVFTYWNRNSEHRLFEAAEPMIGSFIADEFLNFVGSPKTTLLKNARTFLCTGNAAPSTVLPTGLKQLSFVRKGTSTTDSQDTPAITIEKPVLKGAYQGLSSILKQLNTPALVGDLIINDENIGAVGFTDNTMIVRTDDYKVIKVSVGTNIKLANIVGINDLKGITQFNTKGFSSWVSSGLRKTRARRFNLATFQREAAMGGIAAAGIGSMMSSIGNDMTNQYNMYKMMEQQKLITGMQLANQRTITDANNSALLARQQKAFDNSMILKGYSGASAQSGLGYGELNKNFVYSHTQQNAGPQPKEVLNDTVYRKMTENDSESKDHEESPEIEGYDTPIPVPAKDIKTATLLTNHTPRTLTPKQGTVVPIQSIIAPSIGERNMPTLLPEASLATQSQQAVNNIAATKQ